MMPIDDADGPAASVRAPSPDGAARGPRETQGHSRSGSAAVVGSCALVGAGPGDASLLTIAAVRAIRQATVLFVDDLVHPDVLRWARRSARIVPVGKRGGCRSTPQSFIERAMVRAVLDGERVVRLKGGDPLIFGRAGEEMAALRANGIEPSIVNGITAGLAAASDLGMSLTHRDHAQGVLLLTGHEKTRGRPIDWTAVGSLARSGVTVVLYMSVARAAEIAQALASSLCPSTPVAIVERAAREDRRCLTTTLGRMAQTVREEQVASPALLVVGDVVAGCRAALASAEPAVSSRAMARAS